MKKIIILILIALSFISCEISKTTSQSIAPKMVYVQGGIVVGKQPTNGEDFSMGKGVFVPNRTVTLSDFYIGKYEVTQKEYYRVMNGQEIKIKEGIGELEGQPSECKIDNEEYTLFENENQNSRPVENITWYDAVYFCNVLSEKENLTPAYKITVKTIEEKNLSNSITDADVEFNQNANGYRLPTEAEWEYAARGGRCYIPGMGLFLSW